MALDPKTEARLDEYALQARAEFQENWEHWSVRDVALWWQRWCTFERTNHDRLGRILLQVTGVVVVSPGLTAEDAKLFE